jgi:hypothetical protein
MVKLNLVSLSLIKAKLQRSQTKQSGAGNLADSFYGSAAFNIV